MCFYVLPIPLPDLPCTPPQEVVVAGAEVEVYVVVTYPGQRKKRVRKPLDDNQRAEKTKRQQDGRHKESKDILAHNAPPSAVKRCGAAHIMCMLHWVPNEYEAFNTLQAMD